jgi:peptidoglycan/xylan/chitin deacetylase (PgdA/CDA1 family)
VIAPVFRLAEAGGVKLREKLHQLHSRVSHRRPVSLALTRGIISFSFDDFPASAWRRGGAVLEANGVRGTYYVSMGLEGRPWHGDAGFSRDDVAAVVAGGHELGCHTFSHRPCWQLSAAALDEDLDRNARHCRFALGEQPFASFAYPYGLASAAAKRLVGARFAAVRHIRKGINTGTVDLAELRANEISADTPAPALTRLVDRCRDRNGWLLMFTHDVSETPSPWGCTPALFADLVERAVASGCSVLPVGAAVAAIAGAAEAPLEPGDRQPAEQRTGSK